MAISDYFSKFGSTVAPGQGSYSYGNRYGSVDLWRPKIGGLDMGTPVMEPQIASVTGSIDGSSPSVDWLKGLAGAVLKNMGSSGDGGGGGGAQVVPASFGSGGNGGGGMSWGVIALGAVAVGAVIYAAQGK